MRNIVFDIIKNEFMVKQIPKSVDSRLKLIDRMDPIKSKATELSNALESGTISKVKCCPTFWNLIEKYVL